MSFLIQKQGDRTWSSLDTLSQPLEIGQYCLAFEGNYPNQEIEIRITYTDSHSSHITQYYRRFDSQGFLSIFSSQHLDAGSWEIYCRSEIYEEFCGQFWQQTLKIEVNPLSESVELALTVPEADNEPLSLLSEEINDTTEPTLRLTLDETEFTRDQQEILVISGKIESDRPDAIWEKVLYYHFHHPVTGVSLFTLEYPLSNENSALAFRHEVLIPEEWEIPELEAEVQVMSDQGICLASRFFYITTKINENSSNSANLVNYTIELSDSNSELSYTFDLAFAQGISETTIAVELPQPQTQQKSLERSLSSTRSVLPPKIERSQRPSVRHSTLKLPKLPTRSG